MSRPIVFAREAPGVGTMPPVHAGRPLPLLGIAESRGHIRAGAAELRNLRNVPTSKFKVRRSRFLAAGPGGHQQRFAAAMIEIIEVHKRLPNVSGSALGLSAAQAYGSIRAMTPSNTTCTLDLIVV